MAGRTCAPRLLLASALLWLSARTWRACGSSWTTSRAAALPLCGSGHLASPNVWSIAYRRKHCGGTTLWKPRHGRTVLSAEPAEEASTDTAVTDAPFPVPDPFGPLYESRPEGGGDSTVIWLHSGGGSGAFSYLTVGPDFRQALPSTSFLFPTGTMRLPFPRWVSFGYDEVNAVMENTTALLDYGGLDIMDQSVEYVHALVSYEIARGVRPERIFLAGFSNGGAAAIAAGLSSKVRLGGILGLSTFLLGSVPAREHSVPVHLYHGDADPIVPVDWAYHTRSVLETAGVDASLKVYVGMWHSR
eukprot:CAMPEP_0175330798 /NCGR_PEP_ID=MMETSP0095-20121207/912_1 /TAXON_ID=311494 /ORGANISM="Alexandrium monilatum, Strain CCMP3105" /LENGTH=301 /DNA_ID=CAMNT_0016627995 /DNA_START=73 /DNA_END=974 /DNA_ORIENTATION=+